MKYFDEAGKFWKNKTFIRWVLVLSHFWTNIKKRRLSVHKIIISKPLFYCSFPLVSCFVCWKWEMWFDLSLLVDVKWYVITENRNFPFLLQQIYQSKLALNLNQKNIIWKLKPKVSPFEAKFVINNSGMIQMTVTS